MTLSADTAAFQAGMTKAQRQAAMSSANIEKSLRNITRAITGMVGAALGTYFASLAKDALAFAGGLGEVAQKTGTTVEQYQILTRASIAAGVGQGQLDAALVRLNETLGDAKRGSEQAIRALQGVGLTKEQINSFERGGDALPRVMEGLKNVGSAAEQGSRAQEIFGRGAAGLLPVLTQGADGYNAMAEEAQRAGLITAEQAAKADDASDAIDLLAYSLKTNLAVALAENTDAIHTIITALAEMINVAGKAISWMDSAIERGNRFQDRMMANYGLTPAIRERGQRAIVQTAASDARGLVERLASTFIPGYGNSAGGRGGTLPSDTQTDLARAGGRGGRGKSAEQLAREAERERERLERQRIEALRDAFNFESEIRRGKIDELRAQQDLTEDYLSRAILAKQILDAEMEQEREALKLAVQTGELSQAQADQIAQQQAIVAALERERIDLETQERNREVRDRFDQQRFDIERRRLEGEADLAETAAERRQIELRILDLAYQEERERLERLAVEARTFEDQQMARIELAALNDRQALDRAGVMRGSMGPMESFLKSLPDTAAKANEAFEYVAANGLADLIDGIATASFDIKNLGSTFANVAKQIVADLMRIALQRALVSGLSSVLGGIFGGKAPTNLLSGTPYDVPGLAHGGSGIIQGRRGVDTNLLSLNGRPLARVSHGERLTISPDGRSERVYVEIGPSPYFDAHVDQRAGGVVVASAPSIAQGTAARMQYRASRRLA